MPRLKSENRIKTIADGYDPTVRIMHEAATDRRNSFSDFMEPERPRVDCAMLEFRGSVFNLADFVISSNGVCRLNPEIGADGGVEGVKLANLCLRPVAVRF